ncbi:MAG: hypothetical protein EFT35_04705 [Methanophagales archaeon ANME-1-THS]|nr:MAG: hypothetical protein EFT35_04705 [Methanophagales archaeon ANME-1-THS]
MQLGELLDDVIFKEVYKGVKIQCKIPYDFSGIPKDMVEKLKTDESFREECKDKLAKKLQKSCPQDLEVIGIDPSSNCLEIRYTAYYLGSKQHPEVHLKRLLLYYDNRGVDIHDPAAFDRIVEEAKRGLGEKYRNCREKRLLHFATLFKEALAQEFGKPK